MNQFIVKELAQGVTIRNFTDSKFKTMRISMNMIVPLTTETASAGAILPSLVTRATKEHPDISLLSKYLGELYGSGLDSSVSKLGDNQVLGISATGIADRYALEGEKMSHQLAYLICSAVFESLTGEDGLFLEDSFRQEKRQLIETIDADFNEKRIYAKARCQEIMFSGEPAGIRRYGSRKQVEHLQRKSLMEAWTHILETAKVEIFVLGDCDFDAVCQCFAPYFKGTRKLLQRKSTVLLQPKNQNNTEELLAVAQSKLVLGFRTGVLPEQSFPTRLMSVLFGGSPSAKLFVNVREKLSLCYYCGSNLSVEKGAMFVESGVETANIEQAKEAILQQLTDIKNGVFTDQELEFAKLYMLNSYKAVEDSLYAIEGWYLQRIFAGEMMTPEEAVIQVLKVTRQQVIEAAQKTALDTIYVLKGETAHA